MKAFMIATTAMATMGTTHATGSEDKEIIRENIRRLQRTPGGNTINTIEEYEVPIAEESSDVCIQPNCYYPEVFDPENC